MFSEVEKEEGVVIIAETRYMIRVVVNHTRISIIFLQKNLLIFIMVKEIRVVVNFLPQSTLEVLEVTDREETVFSITAKIILISHRLFIPDLNMAR